MTQESIRAGDGASRGPTCHTLHVLVRDRDGGLTTVQELVAVEASDNAWTIDRPSGEPPVCTLPASGSAGLLQLLGLGWLGSRARRAHFQQMK